MTKKGRGRSQTAKRSKSSHRWLNRQKRDYFVRQAQEQGQVSRAHFKLVQLDERYRFLRSARRVLELGAAPGGWTAYVEERLLARKGEGMLIAVDPLPVTASAATHVIEGLVGAGEVDTAIAELLDGARLDLVLSDMAPNISGVRAVDQARAMDLADLARDAAERWLGPGGHLVLKAFQGEGLDEWVAQLRTSFARVQMTKPKASRPESREVFVVALDYGARA